MKGFPNIFSTILLFIFIFSGCAEIFPKKQKINSKKYIRPVQKDKSNAISVLDRLSMLDLNWIDLPEVDTETVEKFEFIPVKVLEREEQRKVLKVKISTDNKYAIVINTFQIYRISLNSLKEEKIIDHRRIVDGGFTGMDVSGDGQWILGGSSWETRAHLYDWNGNSKKVYSCKEKNSYVEDISFSEDNKNVLLSCFQFGKKKKNFLLYDIEGNLLKKQSSLELYSRFYSKDNILTYEEQGITYWNLSEKTLKKWDFGFNIISLTNSNTSNLLLVANPEEWVLFKLENGEVYTSQKVQLENKVFLADYYKLQPDHKNFHALIANDRLVISGGRGGAYLWNLKGKQLKFFPGHSKNVTGVALSAEEDILVTASADKTIVWKRN